jgi:hypothetical protein
VPKLGARLLEELVDEPIRAADRQREFADGLPGLVAAGHELGELRAFGADDADAGSDLHEGAPYDCGGVDGGGTIGRMSDIEVPRTTVVPWETVTDVKGRRAWTAGQLREAIAHLPDDAPIVVHAANYEEGEYDDQIIVGAGHSKVGWGDGYGLEDDPLFALECFHHTADVLLVRPKRPRGDLAE